MREASVCILRTLLVTWCAHLRQRLCYNYGACIIIAQTNLAPARSCTIEANVCILRVADYLVRSTAPETGCILRALLVTWCAHLHQKLCYNYGACIVIAQTALAPAPSCTTEANVCILRVAD
jgi:hypothetical protein